MFTDKVALQIKRIAALFVIINVQKSMNRDKKRKLKTAAVWFLINSAIGLILFTLITWSYRKNLLTVFIITMINTHIISSITAFTGYRIGAATKNRNLAATFIITLAGTMLASSAAGILSTFIISRLFSIASFAASGNPLWRIIPVLTISATVTIITITIERLRHLNAVNERELSSTKSALESSQQKKHAVFTLRDNESHHVINHGDIIYLSSHGKRTSFHTVGKDYESAQLLKDVEDKLPSEKFVRIHKQFIINTSYLESIRYSEGGRYMAFLKDDDESMLPVGRKFVPLLKSRLGINI